MELIRFLAPLCIIVFLTLKLRNSPLKACSIALTLSFAEAVYIPSWTLSFAIPGIPVPLVWRDLVFASLLIAWVYVKQKRPLHLQLRMDWGVFAVLALLCVALLQLPVTWLRDESIKIGVLFAVRIGMYFPVSIIIWIDIFRRCSKEEIMNLFAALAQLAVPTAVMYSLSSIGMSVFPDSKYSSTYYGDTVINRDSLTFTIWIPFALAYFLTKPKIRLMNSLAIGILAIAIVLSYTRSWIIPAVGMFLMTGLYSLITQSRVVSKLSNFIFLIILGSLVSIVLINAVPNNLNYVLTRLEEVQTAGTDAENIVVRDGTIEVVTNYISRVDPVFGLGYSTNTYDDVNYISTSHIIGDSFWASVILANGWSGAIAYSLLIFISILSVIVFMFSRGKAFRSRLGTMLIMIITWSVVRTFASVDYLYYSVALAIPFALVTIENQSLWNDKPITLAEMPILSVLRVSMPEVVMHSPKYRNALFSVAALAIVVYLAYIIAR